MPINEGVRVTSMGLGSILLILSTLIFLYTFFKKANEEKSDWGIHLSSKITCPNCNKKMPLLRRPKNEYQRLFGGWTCDNCETMMNKWGKEVDEFGEKV